MRLSRCHVALFVVAALAGAGSVMSYAAAPGPMVVGMAKFPITVKAGDYNLIAQVIDLPPGAVVPRHTHGGPVAVQVITGEVTLTTDSGSTTVKAGGMFTENPGLVHSAANKGSVTTRVAVAYLIPKGAEVTSLVK
ncbi:MAG TPA: cupin domain-containing protein [bacterium]|nr:cupin domain-containing protein [bacterium]